MFQRIQRLYNEGRLNLDGVINAADKKLITEDEFFTITNITYEKAKEQKKIEEDNRLREEENGMKEDENDGKQ